MVSGYPYTYFRWHEGAAALEIPRKAGSTGNCGDAGEAEEVSPGLRLSTEDAGDNEGNGSGGDEAEG